MSRHISPTVPRCPAFSLVSAALAGVWTTATPDQAVTNAAQLADLLSAADAPGVDARDCVPLRHPRRMSVTPWLRAPFPIDQADDLAFLATFGITP
jgi:hypothetical protein